jgi:hypothetical protein
LKNILNTSIQLQTNQSSINLEKLDVLKKVDSKISELKRFKNSEGRSLEEAVKTMRKLPVLGYQDEVMDFEWPQEKDLLAMPKDKPFKIEKLIYQKD